MRDRTEDVEEPDVPTWCPKCGRRAGTCTCEPFKRLRKKVQRLRERLEEAEDERDLAQDLAQMRSRRIAKIEHDRDAARRRADRLEKALRSILDADHGSPVDTLIRVMEIASCALDSREDEGEEDIEFCGACWEYSTGASAIPCSRHSDEVEEMRVVEFMHPDQFNRRCEALADDLDWTDGTPDSADGLEEMSEAYCTLWRAVFDDDAPVHADEPEGDERKCCGAPPAEECHDCPEPTDEPVSREGEHN